LRKGFAGEAVDKYIKDEKAKKKAIEDAKTEWELELRKKKEEADKVERALEAEQAE